LRGRHGGFDEIEIPHFQQIYSPRVLQSGWFIKKYPKLNNSKAFCVHKFSFMNFRCALILLWGRHFQNLICGDQNIFFKYLLFVIFYLSTSTLCMESFNEFLHVVLGGCFILWKLCCADAMLLISSCTKYIRSKVNFWFFPLKTNPISNM